MRWRINREEKDAKEALKTADRFVEHDHPVHHLAEGVPLQISATIIHIWSPKEAGTKTGEHSSTEELEEMEEMGDQRARKGVVKERLLLEL